MFATALLGEPALSDVTTLKSTIPPGRGTPRCAVASLTPFAIVVPMYASRLKGASTAIVTVRVAEGCFSPARNPRAPRPRSRTGKRREAFAASYATPSRRPAVGHHQHAVGHGPHELGVVLDQDESDAALAHPPEDLREPRQVGGTGARGRLVEEQHPRPRGQRRGEHQEPLLKAVERLGPLGRDRLEPDRPQRGERLAARARRLRTCFRRRRHRSERPAVGRVQRRSGDHALERGQAAEGRRPLQGPKHAGVCACLGPGRRGTPVDEDLARVELEHAAEGTQRGRLPRAVRPTSATASPGATSRSKPSSARTPP